MAGILRAAGLRVEIHDDHFAQNAKDPEWLTATGRNNWIVVTRDERIRYRVAEKQAIRRAKVRAFVLVAHGNLRMEALAEIFLKALPKVRAITAKERAPFIAKIWRDGKVALLES
jgi:predicted nuclease of predicted toxin-antitoxin system